MDGHQITVITLSQSQLEGILQNAIKQALNEAAINKATQAGETIWLSRAEAAIHLKLSLPTLDKLARKGKLTPYKTGRNIRYKLSELNNAISDLKIRYW